MTARRIDDMPAADYHADPWDRPSLSQSLALTLNTQSPAHAYLRHPKLGGHIWSPTREMTRGTIVHELILNGGRGLVEVDFDSFRTKAARAIRDTAIEQGMTPVLSHELEAAREVAFRIGSRFLELGYKLDGQSEVTILWEEQRDSGLVPIRSRLDHITDDGLTVYDLKSTKSANPESIQRSMIAYGYDIQAVSYTAAVEEWKPELAGRVSFVFLFFELEPPFAVTPVVCAGSMETHGRMRWRRAVDLFAECTSTGVWPEYATEPFRVEAPEYAMTKLMGSTMMKEAPF